MAKASEPDCRWYLDSPVSNCGRLKGLILNIAAQMNWDWQVVLAYSPEGILARSPELVDLSGPPG